MKNQLQKGFTLIELLVVIVIIGILATIGVATFQGYFAKARDTERLSAIRNISTMTKTDQVVNDVADYRLGGTSTTLTEAALKAVLTAQGYSVPATKQSVEYFYAIETTAIATVSSDDFVVIVCKESELGTTAAAGELSDVAFVDGTANGIAAFDDAVGIAVVNTACAATPAALVAGATGASADYVVITLD